MAHSIQKPSALIVIYYILAFFYFSQSYILGEDSFLGRPALMFIMIVNVIYMAKCISDPKMSSSLTKAITIFVIINFVYYIFGDKFLMNVPARKSFQIFKTILLSTTCFFPIYYWTRKGYGLEFSSGVLAVAYFLVIYISGRLKPKGINEVDNMGYYYLNFIPFLFLIPGRVYLKIILCLGLNVLIISCAKRGAIITAGIVDIIFFLYIYRSKQLQGGILTKIWMLILICFSEVFAWRQFKANSFVMERFTALQEGNSSGRNTIYENLWNGWSQGYDSIQMIFGGGFCKAPLFNNGLFAHNDWLELLIDLGLVGVLAYVFLIIIMFKCSYEALKPATKYSILTISMIWLSKTFFSMSYLDENSFILMLLLGIMAAKTKIKRNETKKIKIGQYA